MYFESVDAFLEMGGHGLYVWLCYGVGLLVFVTAFISPVLQRKKVLNDLNQAFKRQSGNPNIKDKI